MARKPRRFTPGKIYFDTTGMMAAVAVGFQGFVQLKICDPQTRAGTAELDLQGLGLLESFNGSLTASNSETRLVFQTPDPRVTTPTAGTVSGFHGLARDPETRFRYARRSVMSSKTVRRPRN